MSGSAANFVRVTNWTYVDASEVWFSKVEWDNGSDVVSERTFLRLPNAIKFAKRKTIELGLKEFKVYKQGVVETHYVG